MPDANDEAKVMTVEQAREQRVCRVCRKPIDLSGQPRDAPHEFNERVFPAPKLTFAFGKEFAHTDCIKSALSGECP